MTPKDRLLLTLYAELDLWRSLVSDNPEVVPPYIVVPGAALNTVVKSTDRLLATKDSVVQRLAEDEQEAAAYRDIEIGNAVEKALGALSVVEGPSDDIPAGWPDDWDGLPFAHVRMEHFDGDETTGLHGGSALCVAPDQEGTILGALLKARKPPPYTEVYPLDRAYIWKRTSTDEWVLELEGSINGTAFFVRHPQPGDLTPEDAVGLPTRYPEPTLARWRLKTIEGEEALPWIIGTAEQAEGLTNPEAWEIEFYGRISR